MFLFTGLITISRCKFVFIVEREDFDDFSFEFGVNFIILYIVYVFWYSYLWVVYICTSSLMFFNNYC